VCCSTFKSDTDAKVIAKGACMTGNVQPGKNRTEAWHGSTRQSSPHLLKVIHGVCILMFSSSMNEHAVAPSLLSFVLWHLRPRMKLRTKLQHGSPHLASHLHTVTLNKNAARALPAAHVTFWLAFWKSVRRPRVHGVTLDCL